MNLLSEIKALITTESSINRYSIPEEAPDITCCVYQIAGRSPDLDLEGIVLRNPSFRILVRDIDYDNAESRMEAIIQTLTTAQTSNILAIYMESDMIDIPRDKECKLVRIYCNFTCKHV